MNKFFLLVLLYLSIFLFSCEKDKVIEIDKNYGEVGKHEILDFTEADYAYSTIFYPGDLSTMDNKSPLVFIASGWYSEPQTAAKYKTLINFIVSHGYTVVYTYEGAKTNATYSINGYNKILSSGFVKENLLDYIDTSKIGVIGHSAGGGIVFRILDYYSKEKQYGNNGRFIMTLDPWFAFDMSESDMKNLPSNTNVVFIKFGIGGNNSTDGTDARIPLTEFYLLESISNDKKDYQIYENAEHSYPTGNPGYSKMQGVLKPLGALLDYTFVTQTEKIRKIALENGNDDPYANGNGIQVVKPRGDYPYPCDGVYTQIDHCKIVP